MYVSENQNFQKSGFLKTRQKCQKLETFLRYCVCVSNLFFLGFSAMETDYGYFCEENDENSDRIVSSIAECQQLYSQQTTYTHGFFVDCVGENDGLKSGCKFCSNDLKMKSSCKSILYTPKSGIKKVIIIVGRNVLHDLRFFHIFSLDVTSFYFSKMEFRI